MVADAHRRLEIMKTVAGAGGTQVQTTVLIGRPALTIIEKSAECDLIVMGTHGRTGLSHAGKRRRASRTASVVPCADRSRTGVGDESGAKQSAA